MLPLRLVIDTNVLVSAALKPEGLQRTTLILATTKPARLYVSRPILEEYEDVLSRPELRIRKGLRLQLLQLIKNSGHIVAPSRRLDMCGDPVDTTFLECADKAGADYLITGNSRHFPKFWKKTKDHHVARVHQPYGTTSNRIVNLVEALSVLETMPTLRLDINEAEFKQHLVATLPRGRVKLHHAVGAAVQAGISQQLDQLVAAGTCLRYGFKNGNQSRVASLQEALEHNGFDFWYLDIQVDCIPVPCFQNGTLSPLRL